MSTQMAQPQGKARQRLAQSSGLLRGRGGAGLRLGLLQKTGHAVFLKIACRYMHVQFINIS